MSRNARLAVDIGGTFTDLVLEKGDGGFSSVKVLTTPHAPEQAVLEGTKRILAEAGVTAGEIGLVIHGTTLATNALIERKGAKTALIATEGFRDSVEIAYEHRFEQYDLYMERPAPLVPRHLRLTVRERLAADGSVLLPLDETAVEALIPILREEKIEAVAIGFLHSYANNDHEKRAGAIIAAALPDVAITLSSDVCPEIREYERMSTACANAYVQPLMAGYIKRLESGLQALGLDCPLLLMMSSGGVTTVETAVRQPIRLVESGPAGGVILALDVAAENGVQDALSFDMGGTTAKLTLIDGLQPQYGRTFEVARAYRFLKGSGLPLRIPVIDMVEIGAGGGSIARTDALKRINVGPDSAGSDPGPACYGQGGSEATVTDGDLVLGRIDPANFAGGKIVLDGAAAEKAVATHIAGPLGMDAATAAAGIAEIVDENMASAARVHAVENGKDTAGRTLIAFGGAAPLHAARLAEKLGINRVIVPKGAGVGSAYGFLRAPIGYEVVRTRLVRLQTFEPHVLNDLFAEMRAEAEAVVRLGAPAEKLVEVRTAFMRYRGQGHEITVTLPNKPYGPGEADAFKKLFAEAYTALFGRIIPGLEIEALSWTLSLSTARDLPRQAADPAATPPPAPSGRRQLFDTVQGVFADAAVYARTGLAPGMAMQGPAVIVEDETCTVVPAAFTARINTLGQIVLERGL
jgi:N-methylhydantoinase A